MNTGQACTSCECPSACAYGYVFETTPEQDSGFMGKYDQIPRPYVLEIPLNRQTEFEPGELLALRLRLFGRAIDYAPLFVTTFQEMGKDGIGKGRLPYQLVQVESEGFNQFPVTIYQEGAEQIHAPLITTGVDIRHRSQQADASRSERVTLFFDTPLRIKWNGQYTSDPQFHVIFRNILRRVTGLLQFHHGESWEVNFADLLRRAETIKLIRQETRWVDYSRYSNRQETKMKLGGIMGWVQYEGDLAEFLPWLRVAELLHIGKNTVFDLGRIRVG
ncbi:CRISPR system precrRNA processing endoribonuclease RAMP protein Cas6 [Tumebacillus flagellatus]|nr:CRISPR system precrRNA processing endoribonuclease RAMP protein Cas6 [Tumebacillus flagellatus]